MLKTYTIYMHKNKINNKVYIGQTSTPVEIRWKNGAGYKTCLKFYNAIQKYGWDNFEHIILKEGLTLSEANYWEQYYIQQYNSFVDGYNSTLGGKNCTMADSTKEKLRIINTGKKMSEDSKEKMKKNHANVKGANNPMYGKHRTSAEKAKMGAIKIKCIELDMTFDSYCDAARYVGLKSHQSIGNYFMGKTKSAGKHPITKEPLHWAIINC